VTCYAPDAVPRDLAWMRSCFLARRLLVLVAWQRLVPVSSGRASRLLRYWRDSSPLGPVLMLAAGWSLQSTGQEPRRKR
jgi:hypothetical protein